MLLSSARRLKPHTESTLWIAGGKSDSFHVDTEPCLRREEIS
jgi:hypothetical protein